MNDDLKTIAISAFDLVWTKIQLQNISNDDRTSVEGFDANLLSLESLLQAFQDVAKAKTMELRIERNTSLPISKLPLETLVSIFHLDMDHTWHNCETGQFPARLSTLSAVSKSWKNIIQSTPSLWSRIHTKLPVKFFRTAIERSRKHRISVGGELTNKDLIRKEATLSACSQIYRWSSAQLVVDSDAELDLLTYSAAPALQVLDVVCLQTDDSARIPINLFDGKAPELKHVTLDGFQPVWTSPVFTGLHSLALYDVLGLALNQLLSLLQNCPLLQHITICQLQFSAQANTEPSPVTLFNLKQLHIRDCEAEVLHGVLSNVECPVADQVTLTLPTSPHLLAPDQQLLAMDPITTFTAGFLRRGIGGKDPVAFDWKPTAYSFSFGDPNLSSLTLQSGSEAPISEGFMEKLEKTGALPEIALVIGEGEGRWQSLGSLGCITGVVAVHEAGFVTYLGTPTQEVDAWLWPFSNLKDLFLEGAVCKDAEEIVGMIQSRKGRLHPDSTGAKRLPKPLNSLTLAECPMDRVTLLKLKTVSPETEVGWEPPKTAVTLSV